MMARSIRSSTSGSTKPRTSCACSCSTRRSIRREATSRRRRELFKLAWKYRRIGKKFYRLMDLLTMSADDFLARWFEHSVTRAVLGYYCSIGTFAGPKTPGSAYVVLHHIMGEHEGAGGWGFIRGGMGAISDAIAESGRRHGMEIRTDAEVVRIEVAAGRASKVVTAGGEEFTARAVVGNASCKSCSTAWSRQSTCRPISSSTFATIGPSRRHSRSMWLRRRLPRFPAFDAARCGFDATQLHSHRPDGRIPSGGLRRRLPGTLFKPTLSSRPSCRRPSMTRWRRRGSMS